MIALRCLVALSGWIALAATGLPEASPARLVVPSLFLLVCPGLAAVLLWAGELIARGQGGAARLLEGALLVGAVSLSLTALVTEALLLTHTFTLARAVLILAVLCSALVLAAGLHSDGRRAHRATAGKD
ncbi:hypothetical protein [Streptomyces massasporeus]|uniref:hypothetical protein n=1 Tax=Streptomyces massasporeus TaxID=67324 RepID=UPI00340B51AA